MAKVEPWIIDENGGLTLRPVECVDGTKRYPYGPITIGRKRFNPNVPSEPVFYEVSGQKPVTR